MSCGRTRSSSSRKFRFASLLAAHGRAKNAEQDSGSNGDFKSLASECISTIDDINDQMKQHSIHSIAL